MRIQNHISKIVRFFSLFVISYFQIQISQYFSELLYLLISYFSYEINIIQKTINTIFILSNLIILLILFILFATLILVLLLPKDHTEVRKINLFQFNLNRLLFFPLISILFVLLFAYFFGNDDLLIFKTTDLYLSNLYFIIQYLLIIFPFVLIFEYPRFLDFKKINILFDYLFLLSGFVTLISVIYRYGNYQLSHLLIMLIISVINLLIVSYSLKKKKTIFGLMIKDFILPKLIPNQTINTISNIEILNNNKIIHIDTVIINNYYLEKDETRRIKIIKKNFMVLGLILTSFLFDWFLIEVLNFSCKQNMQEFLSEFLKK